MKLWRFVKNGRGMGPWRGWSLGKLVFALLCYLNDFFMGIIGDKWLNFHKKPRYYNTSSLS